MQIDHVVESAASLKDVLKKELEISSRLMTDLVKNDLIRVDGFKTNVNDMVTKGSHISIDLNYEKNTYESTQMTIDVIYEDDMILVVNKDSGIVVHPTNGVKTGTLLNAVSYYQKVHGLNYKIRFVNRIDMGTSGVVVIAKNKFSMNKYSTELSSRRVSKEYLAVVHGVVDNEITVDAPLMKEIDSPKRVVKSDGKNAITKFIPITNNGNLTLIRALPLTGRTHQIRSHLLHIGHPIVGDELYGFKDNSRLMLHCNKMTFERFNMSFEATVPDCFNI